MQKITSYKKWSQISDNERIRESMCWDTYAGEGQDILKEAVKELRIEHKLNDDIVEINGGLYHGGILVINAILKKGINLKFPSQYKGFPVMKSFKK